MLAQPEQSWRLRIPRSLPIAETLTKELQAFKRTVTKVGSGSV